MKVLFLLIIILILIFIVRMITLNIKSFKYDKILSKLFKEKRYIEIIDFVKQYQSQLGIFYSQYNLALAYFSMDDQKRFQELKTTMIYFDKGINRIYCIMVDLLWTTVLYMQNKIDEADKCLSDIENRMTTAQINLQRSKSLEQTYKLAKFIYLFFKDDLSSLEVLANELNLINDSKWAVVNYYMCEIYEKRGENDKIKPIILEAEIRLAENPYKSLFDKWEHVK